MRNIEARKIRQRIRYGSLSRCPTCRSRDFAVIARTDTVVCTSCGTSQHVDEFLERELSVYESKKPLTVRR